MPLNRSAGFIYIGSAEKPYAP